MPSIPRQSAHILLEGTPIRIDLMLLRKKLLEIPGVAEVHDLHLWTLTSGMNSASVHIKAADDCERERIRNAVQNVFVVESGVDHSTQIEWGSEGECRKAQNHP